MFPCDRIYSSLVITFRRKQVNSRGTIDPQQKGINPVNTSFQGQLLRSLDLAGENGETMGICRLNKIAIYRRQTVYHIPPMNGLGDTRSKISMVSENNGLGF